MAARNPIFEHAPSGTVAIVGAGLCGTALALRLLWEPHWSIERIVLVERSGRFGPGLAYGGGNDGALLNVPATQMSINELEPGDFVDYLHSRGHGVFPNAFVPRRLYGDYLEFRLLEAACFASGQTELVRVSGDVAGLARARRGSGWQLRLSDDRTVEADSVVLALGHAQPRTMEALRSLIDTGLYVDNPWEPRPTSSTDNRVLIVGTGLTMADVVCELAGRQHGPSEIVAISRRGLLSRSRGEAAVPPHVRDVDISRICRAGSLRNLIAEVRAAVATVECVGGDWRDVIAAIRPECSRIWKGLSGPERRRFIRHLQPYWDVHRHQLPPQVDQRVCEFIGVGRLKVRAARIVSAHEQDGRALVRVRPRGSRRIECMAFDRVINCSGPDVDPRRSASTLVRALLASGTLTADPTGLGIQVDASRQPINRSGDAVRGLYYLGPWLRGREWEVTAARELRQQATALAESLRLRAAVADRAAIIDVEVEPDSTWPRSARGSG